MKLGLPHRKKDIHTLMKSYKKRYLNRWMILVVTTLVLLVAIFLFHLYFFTRVSSETFFKLTVAPSQTAEAIAKKKLEETLSYFTVRKEKTDEILSQGLIFEDPSIAGE